MIVPERCETDIIKTRRQTEKQSAAIKIIACIFSFDFRLFESIAIEGGQYEGSLL